MPLGRFMVFSALGSLPWNAALIYAGFVVGENYPQIEAALRPCEIVIYVARGGPGVLILVGRWLVVAAPHASRGRLIPDRG